jgi:hypothetical protein
MKAAAMRSLMVFLVLLFVGGGAARAQESEPIGYVKTVEGEAFVVRGAERIAAEPGTAVYRSDVLETGADGAIGLTLKDSTRLSMGASTELTLSRFEFVPSQNQLGFVARITRGTLLYVSGVIAKLSADAVSVETPVATIAVRGTRFLVKVEDQR